MKLTLLVLAAGMGSRYGGLKQIDPVGPGGEAIIDYSVFDAMRAGFDKLVFVIRHDIEDAFKETIGKRFEGRISVEYVYQELNSPPGHVVPPARKKPWGTGHAILMAADTIREPFAVINADDFYGARSYRVLAEHLRSNTEDYSMVGFILRNTVSEFGSVARGICNVDKEGCLDTVTEYLKIEKRPEGIRYTDPEGKIHPMTGDEIVSMNMWGFSPSLFDYLRRDWKQFITTRGHEEKSEFFIPTVVNNLVESKQKKLKVLHSPAQWFGVTYREDRPVVIDSIRKLIASGEYPEKLWS
jgi:UTP-glucose-1-phosphate uridylyltransferase